MAAVHDEPGLHWWEHLGANIEAAAEYLGGRGIASWLRESGVMASLEALLEGVNNKKDHVGIIIGTTAVFGMLFGLLLYYLFAGLRNLGALDEEEEPAPKDPKTEEEANAEYSILRGKFNDGVIGNLHKWNRQHGEVVRLQEAEGAEGAASILPAEDSGEDAEEDDDETEDIQEIDYEQEEVTIPLRPKMRQDSGRYRKKKLAGKDPAKKAKKMAPVGEEKEEDDEDDGGFTSLGEREMMGKLGELHGKLATARLRQESLKMQAKMTKSEVDEEAAVRKQQLEAILSMMKDDKEKFGIDSSADLYDQMNALYNI